MHGNRDGTSIKFHELLYINKELQKVNVVVSEIEKIATDFSAAYKIVWAYLDSLECHLLNDPEKRCIITEDAEMDNYRMKLEIPSNQTLNKTRNSLKTQNNSGKALGERLANQVKANHCPEAGLNKLQNSVNTEKPYRNTETFVRTDGFVTPNIGYDMLTQLKPLQITTFSGNKSSYPSWKAAFMACVDRAAVTPEYKMLQLRHYVSGEALIAIENLGYSPAAYETAKDRLERKYGGMRRQKAGFMEDLEQFQQIQSGNAEEPERFADLLSITIINL